MTDDTVTTPGGRKVSREAWTRLVDRAVASGRVVPTFSDLDKALDTCRREFETLSEVTQGLADVMGPMLANMSEPEVTRSAVNPMRRRRRHTVRGAKRR